MQKAEKIVFDSKLDKEYLPITGHAEFQKLSAELAYGKDSGPLKADQVMSDLLRRYKSFTHMLDCYLSISIRYRSTTNRRSVPRSILSRTRRKKDLRPVSHLGKSQHNLQRFRT